MFEQKSDLIGVETAFAPEVDNPIMDFVPAVRSGRRAPHVWLDEARTISVLDGFGAGYALVLGADVDSARWNDSVKRLADLGVPVSSQQLPPTENDSVYARDGVVLVRPDGIIADHWLDGEVAAAGEHSRLTRLLPLDGLSATDAA